MKLHILKITLFIVILSCSLKSVNAQRNWLQQSINQSELSTDLNQIDVWRKNLKQSVLQSLNEIPDTVKTRLIQNAKRYLSFQWPNLPATIFLQFGETGNRSNYQRIRRQRRKVLSALVIGELLEQKGQFIPQIVNGVWAICEESTWALPAHLSLQYHYTPLPNPGENIVDLGDALTSDVMSWIYLLLHDQLDSVTAVIPRRIQYELERRVINPYLKRNDFWWMGFHDQQVNNWNPWVNGSVLLSSLLTEENKNKMDSTVYKTMRSVDHFINQYPSGGGCDEGPAYWSHAGGKLITYLNHLKSATFGKIDLNNHPLIGKMGRYIYKMNIDQNYFVDFADAHPKLTPDIVSVFNFGQACNSDTLKQFASYFVHQNGSVPTYFLHLKNSLSEFIRYLQIFPSIRSVQPINPLIKEAWFSELQVLTIRSEAGSAKGLFMAAEGGNNGVSHNHNDVGNFIIYVNGKPAIIDIGVGTYTRQTFSKNRYKIFTMQSAWHNLPTINGVMQHAGSKYKANNVQLTRKGNNVTLSMNIATAYPKEADTKSWERKISFNGKQVSLKEKYVLNAYKIPFTLSFITPMTAKVEDNVIILKDYSGNPSLRIHFNDKKFSVKVETKTLTDPSLQHSWGNQLFRILLTDKTHQKKGDYQINFQAVHQ